MKMCLSLVIMIMNFPGGAGGKESTCKCRRHKRYQFDPWVRKIPCSRKWQSAPVFSRGKSHGERSLEGYSLCGCKELNTTEQLSIAHDMIRILSSLRSTGYCAKRGKGLKKKKLAAEFPLEIQLSGFPCGSAGKESGCNVEDPGLIPGLGRCPEKGNGYPLQYKI